MERITKAIYAEAIGAALDLLSPAVKQMLMYTHFLTGTDPIYAGLHNYRKTNDGRSYRNTAHVIYPHHASDKRERTTVVLPEADDADTYVIIHELGHCLDEILGFEHKALPLNNYAKTNRMEAFAEAFAIQYFWLGAKAEDTFQSDRATQYLFWQLNGR